MKIAVVGAGAIGGFLAAALARSGADVAVVARGEHLNVIRKHGITIVASDLGPFTCRVRASNDLRELGDVDVAIMAFKAHQWHELLPQMQSLAASDATIVTFQNGVPFWYLRTPPLERVDPKGSIGALFPDERIVGGVVHVSGHIAAPGKIHQSGGLRYLLGAPNGGSNKRVEALAAAMKHAEMAPEVDANVRETLWLKLVNNSGLNPVSALHHVTIHQLLNRPALRAEVRALMEETVEIGRALRIVEEVDVEARLQVAARLADVRTSMLQDLEARRTLELDPIVGAAIELAERANVNVPRLRDAYERLRALAPV